MKRKRNKKAYKLADRLRAAGMDSAALIEKSCSAFGMTRRPGETISALCARTVGMTTEQYLAAMGLMLEGYTSAEAERMIKGGATRNL